MEVQIDWWVWLWENEIIFSECFTFSRKRVAGSLAESQSG